MSRFSTFASRMKVSRYAKPAETFFAKLRFRYYSDYRRLTPDQEQLQCRVKTIVRLIP